MDFSKLSDNSLRQHIRLLDIRNREDWENLCPDSLSEATQRGLDRFEKITEGLARLQKPGDPDRRVVTGHMKPLAYCVRYKLINRKQLRAHSPSMLKKCPHPDGSPFWQAVRILLGLEKLPDDFDPIESPIPLSLEHLRELGFRLPPGRTK